MQSTSGLIPYQRSLKGVAHCFFSLTPTAYRVKLF
uniref:Uncharacterized protein n=1 Tax=Arundo donax TaxID=35708 RepID=A0A0A9HD43_ARUDO